jgi:hypothetical protein
LLFQRLGRDFRERFAAFRARGDATRARFSVARGLGARRTARIVMRNDYD